MMCEIAGIPLELEFEKDKPSGSIARGADLTKLKSYFDYEYKYTVREGFERMYDWLAKENE
jgi:nucleoside-diphosphate-sugar epimerase